ncbi:hypothetical protein V493_08175 [Pseudogymnoascus sp. VKM F-4281 (FW-2241)]|nr:hypothetical protein V493_08175 [Pseudogymnoascus sp. VKM F-4281 (FW-2241)]
MEDDNRGDVLNQEYPRDETPPMHILDLPMDIFINIFDSFYDNRSTGYDVDFKTIQSARLVCSLFNRVASPHLCPALTIQLDQISLDLVDEISRSPLIAAGVRRINVRLRYHPKELADDLLRYKNRRKKDLVDLSLSCNYSAGLWAQHCNQGGYGEDDENLPVQPLRVYEKAIETYRAMASAWDYCFLWPDVEAMDDDTFRYWKILRRAHEQYRRKHEEQFKLIMDGSFVETLASAISRMGHRISIHFHDKMSLSSDLYPNSYDPTLVLTNPEKFSRVMTNSFDWRTIERLEGGAELLPAKILSELPIAIYKAGAAMSVMELDCFPATNNCFLIRPDRPSCNPAWPDLRSACQHLTEFKLRGHLPPSRYLLPEEQAVIYEYLSTILSGQNIENLHLDFYSLGVNNGSRAELQGLYRVISVLTTAHWPQIKRLTVIHASLYQGELEKFCRRLDGGRIERIALDDLLLVGGSWAGALDILRERVASRCLDGKCEVYFDDLRGGEFEKKRIKKTKRHGFHAVSDDCLDDEEKLSVVQAQIYVSGVGSLNPLTSRVRVKQWVNPARSNGKSQ